MQFGKSILRRGCKGEDVAELQLRLAGFNGTVWDGIYGHGTERQVIAFQRDYMNEKNPDGIVGPNTIRAIYDFANEYPIDFEPLKCQCGKCDGFGNGLNFGVYLEGKPRCEAYCQYEYPGIHKAILHAFRACMFYAVKYGYPIPFPTCGYRCTENNRQKGRKSTNHFGKAVDFDFPMQTGDDKKDDMERCNSFRNKMVEFGLFQIGWANTNQKSLEPSRIAPTWIHGDIRNYTCEYLSDKYFVKSIKELDV